ncbi:C-4 methylsterol oxidase [Purpureocillium lavendulum]|uniref:C-4 methylsterol oxidase n=1 Tax=Purpureocillium lavendulum TaxID=1247861 RepID=A0AB34FM93_9HYPO|nr:C-4 methylsterol oxidase [Purpureocillium lavendulum]
MTPASPESSSMRGDARDDQSGDDGVGERPAKRQRQSHDTAASGVPHRRQAACQPCRLRKVKCDKKRPSCSICTVSGQDCEYIGDQTEKISLETATATLLDRFEQLQREFEGVKRALHAKDQRTPSQTHSFSAPAEDPSLSSQLPPRLSTVEPSRDFLQIPPHRASADTVLRWDIFQDKYPPNALIGGLFSPDQPDPNADTPSSDLIINTSGLTPPEDEQIPNLIDRFLQNVHTKNPILDVEALIKHGRRCADQGIGWDGRSCLVLLACALGAVAKPFGRSVPPTSSLSAGTDDSTRNGSQKTSSRLYAKELQLGDSCFTLACRRLGSLKYSMLGAQCHFFAGVYLMYTLRPILSWHYFLHASIFCQVHLRMTHGILGDFTEVLSAPSRHSSSTDRKSRRLEQSLYWSCFKSECEFRVELPLQQSEISLGEYPDLFPSPPSPIPTDDKATGTDSLDHTSPTTSSLGGFGGFESRPSVADEAAELRKHAVRLCNEEESWYYYMTEIALRRIGNRIINTFFRQERSTWAYIKPLLRMAQEFEAQVSSWSAHLPPAMQHYETTFIIRAPHLNWSEAGGSHASRELSWAIDNRLLEMQTWLYQPFLYYLVHFGSSRGAGTNQKSRISSLLNPFSPPKHDSPQSLESFNARAAAAGSGLDAQDLAVLHSLIASGIECSLKTIDVRSRGHRHHGLWYDLRSIMCASLVLLAVVKSGNAAWIPGGTETLWGAAPSPEYWTGTPTPIGGKIAKVLAQFDFWAGEAPDLLRYKEVLETVVRDVRGS